jgi:hypothetical protein
MKKLMILATLSLMSMNLFAQIKIGDVNINEKPDVEYIKVRFFNNLTNVRVYVTVEYGQELNLSSDDNLLKGADGKRMIFNTEVAGLNYFYANGWEVVQIIPKDSEMKVGAVFYSYLLRKKK